MDTYMTCINDLLTIIPLPGHENYNYQSDRILIFKLFGPKCII